MPLFLASLQAFILSSAMQLEDSPTGLMSTPRHQCAPLSGCSTRCWIFSVRSVVCQVPMLPFKTTTGGAIAEQGDGGTSCCRTETTTEYVAKAAVNVHGLTMQSCPRQLARRVLSRGSSKSASPVSPLIVCCDPLEANGFASFLSQHVDCRCCQNRNKRSGSEWSCSDDSRR